MAASRAPKRTRTALAPAAGAPPRGTVIAIGGHEDKEHAQVILREVAARCGSGTLVIATIASEQAAESFAEYERVFRTLGVRKVEHLDVHDRAEVRNGERLALMKRARGVFFTGGDQLKITTKLGGTPVCQEMSQLLRRGGVIAGTSAGASVVAEAMLVRGPSDSSVRVRDETATAPASRSCGAWSSTSTSPSAVAWAV